MRLQTGAARLGQSEPILHSSEAEIRSAPPRRHPDRFRNTCIKDPDIRHAHQHSQTVTKPRKSPRSSLRVHTLLSVPVIPLLPSPLTLPGHSSFYNSPTIPQGIPDNPPAHHDTHKCHCTTTGAFYCGVDDSTIPSLSTISSVLPILQRRPSSFAAKYAPRPPLRNPMAATTMPVHHLNNYHPQHRN